MLPTSTCWCQPQRVVIKPKCGGGTLFIHIHACIPMLEVKHLTKNYGKLIAVTGVSFRADRGETIGLLGPNGAGKTTTVSIIAGLLSPDSGEVLIEGKQVNSDTDPVKLKIGLVPQDMALYDKLSARDNLTFFAALYSLAGAKAKQAIDDVLNLVGLSDRAGDKVETFSGGMKRRLNLAAALLHDPQILLLDEPTVGVDPQSRNAIFDHVDGFKPEQMLTLSEVKSAELQEGTLRVGVHDLFRGAPGVLRWLAENGHSYHHVSSEQPDLETVFLTLTGRS